MLPTNTLLFFSVDLVYVMRFIQCLLEGLGVWVKARVCMPGFRMFMGACALCVGMN